MTRVEKLTNLPRTLLINVGIYKIWFANDEQKRVYIGSATRNGKKDTEKGFLSRWNLHLSNLINNYNCTPKLQNAFKKYGLENIRFEILEILEPNKKQAYYEDIETMYIAKFDSVNNGWNVNINGRNCIGTPMREEVKQKIGASNKGKNNGMYGKFGKLNPNAKKVYQYDLEGNFVKEWDSARSVERILNIPYKQISQSFKTQSKYCKGFLWYCEYKGAIVNKYVKYDKIQNIKKSKNYQDRIAYLPF